MSGLLMQTCTDCGAVQHPRRDVCRACLGDALADREVSAAGRVLSVAKVHASHEAGFPAPWPIASVALSAGPTIVAHCPADARSGTTVEVRRLTDPAGRSVLAVGAQPLPWEVS